MSLRVSSGVELLVFQKKAVQHSPAFATRYCPSPDNSTAKPPLLDIQEGVELDELNKKVLPESCPAAILEPSSDIATDLNMPEHPGLQ